MKSILSIYRHEFRTNKVAAGILVFAAIFFGGFAILALTVMTQGYPVESLRNALPIPLGLTIAASVHFLARPWVAAHLAAK